jgi:hypothetical protein
VKKPLLQGRRDGGGMKNSSFFTDSGGLWRNGSLKTGATTKAGQNTRLGREQTAPSVLAVGPAETED